MPDHPIPAGTRTRILAAALDLFAERGFDAANINDIVARAGSTKPMIYYHFGNKEGLFAAALEHVYAGMREIESSLQLDHLTPHDAIRRLVHATFDYHAAHPDWIRLISTANIHAAQHIRDSQTIASANSPVLAIIRDLLARGERAGAFRAGVDPLHLHLLINSFSFYRVSNRHTWRVIFQRDLSDDALQQREMLAEAVLRYLS